LSLRRLRGLVALLLTVALVTLLAPVFVLVRLALGRRAAAEKLGAWASALILRIAGVQVESRLPEGMPETQRVYVSNHSSSIDVFVLLSLALPRTCFFMKRGAWVFPPGALVALCVGTFFTVPQAYTDRRRKLFAAACEALRKSGDSVYLSPEGTRVTTGGVGPFNKGAFHLAAALGAPIVPLYLEIPRDENPGKSWVMTRTRVIVHLLPTVDTSGWRAEEAAERAQQVRASYRAFEAEREAARGREAA
jgi:1-acyl-sn-glycerol-3-phosphate acyltransferase